MGSYVIFYGLLKVFMGSYEFLCAFMSFMGFYHFLWVFMSSYCSYEFFNVLVGYYVFLWVLMGSNGFLYVFIGYHVF